MTTKYQIPTEVLFGPYADVAERVRFLVAPSARCHGITYNRPGEWVIRLLADRHNAPRGRIYLQVGHLRPDTITGVDEWGYGGKAYLSQHATDSELVQTIFGLFRAYEEHECREAFLWDGAQVYGPHLDVTALRDIAALTDARPALVEG